MYDLDKTQEWLNRTQQIGRTPALRGGLAPDYRARRHTALSVLFALTVVALGILLFTRLRPPALTSDSGEQFLTAPGSTRIADMSAAPSVAPATARPAARPYVRRVRPPSQLDFDAPDTLLDGPVVPLPGHVAPPAPIWLDGVSRSTNRR